MNNILDKKLCEKYPKIFINRYADMRTTAMCWGFECDDGWYDLIDTMCFVIQSHLDNHPDVPQLIADQVKEKYGELRFYSHGGDLFTEGVQESICILSFKICEVCGNKGEMQDKAWIKTVCEKHKNFTKI